MAYRKAASVFPEPVGAWISVCAPDAITGQPFSCAGVGASNAASNQARVFWLKTSRGPTAPEPSARLNSYAEDPCRFLPAPSQVGPNVECGRERAARPGQIHRPREDK